MSDGQKDGPPSSEELVPPLKAMVGLLATYAIGLERKLCNCAGDAPTMPTFRLPDDHLPHCRVAKARNDSGWGGPLKESAQKLGYPGLMRDTLVRCHDCGRPYGDQFGFPDLVLPNDVWAQISPTGDEGGMLCPSCIVRRCVAAGVECEATWTSGPFVHKPLTKQRGSCNRCGKPNAIMSKAADYSIWYFCDPPCYEGVVIDEDE